VDFGPLSATSGGDTMGGTEGAMLVSASDTEIRRVELPDGRALVVRRGTRADLGALSALYAGLSDDDNYLRFFSAHRPGPDLFERMISIRERGGELLLAEVGGDGVAEVGGDGAAEVGGDGAAEVVADAWYSLLENGDGEFAITVARPWRGWLGAYLLDALLEVAAANGVPNLEAEILLRNRPMMGLVRRRGCVRTADDGSAAHVVIGTRGGLPSWPPASDRPRVVVEGHTGWRALDAAARRGIDVLVCPGPLARAQGCPVLEGGSCPLVDGADAAVVSLAVADPRLRELVRAHRRRRPDLPIVVESRVDEADVDATARVDPTTSDGAVVDLLLGLLGGTERAPEDAGAPAGSSR
jgi:hypothetical protein